MLVRSKFLEQMESGQGIVEYAMIMTFVLSIAIALYYSGLKQEVRNIFESVSGLYR